MERPPSAEEILARVSALGRFALFCMRIREDGSLERVWGSTGDPTPPEDWFQRVYPDDLPAAKAALARLVGGKDREIVELRLFIGDEIRWVQTRLFRMVRDEPGTFLCGAMVDITDLKIAEEKACAVNRQYRALFNDNPMPIATFRVRGERVYLENCNDAAIAFAGESLGESLGRDMSEMLPPGDEGLEAIRRCARERVKFVRRDHRLLVTGEKKDVIRTYVAIPPDIVMVHTDDITEQERARAALTASEALFRALVQHAPDAVSLIDARGVFLYESPASASFFGPLPGGTPRRAALDFIHPDDLTASREILAGVRASGHGSVTRFEARLRRADGLYRTVALKATNHLDEPAIAGIVVNFQDITESRELEHELAQSQKVEAMGQLAGGVAHDFNNLLAVILNFTSLVIEELPEGDPKREDLLEVVRATERGARLTRQLLAFARKEVQQPRVIDLVATLRVMEELLHRTLGEHIATSFTLPSTLMPVKVDQTRFEQVLLNLALNARDAMPRGGHLRFTLEGEVRDGNDRVVLTVSDDGPGIPDDVMPRIFEPFFTTKSAGLGTGLGLATVHAVVEQAGGTIQVFSRPDKGTTFRISFPRTRSVEAPEAVASTPVAAPATIGKRIVLVVEDDDAVRRTVVRVLEHTGFVARSASGALEAIEMMRDDGDDVSVVLSDVVMPDMSGVALIEQLRASRPNLPAVLMSGHVSDVLEAQGVLSKGISLLDKPFTRAQIVEKLEAVLTPRPPPVETP